MRKFFFIAIGLFVLMLSACRSSRQVVQQATSDSTTVVFREVEKVVHIEGDSVSVNMQAKLDRPSTGSGTVALINAPVFIPQVQDIETKRTKVRIELTGSGQIKATAVSKELDEKVTVLEKTITTSKSSVTVFEKKDNWLKRTWDSLKKSVNTILLLLLVVAVVATAIKLGFNPISILKKLFNKS